MNQDNTPADQYYSEAFIKSLHGQVVQMKDDLAECRSDLAEFKQVTQRNTESIDRVEKDTREIVETFRALSGGFKVLQGLGRLAKPLAYIVGLVTAIITAYSAWRGMGR